MINIDNNVLISGDLSIQENITGSLTVEAGLTGSLIVPESVDYEKYDDEYVVDPKFRQQILETENKLMRENVVINEIAVSTVQNPQGGNTIWIGVI